MSELSADYVWVPRDAVKVPGPYPTVETVGVELCLSILTKILATQERGGYVDLEYNRVVLDCGVWLTDEELDLLRRLEAARTDGSDS
jgi:hypothetical protein